MGALVSSSVCFSLFLSSYRNGWLDSGVRIRPALPKAESGKRHYGVLIYSNTFAQIHVVLSLQLTLLMWIVKKKQHSIIFIKTTLLTRFHPSKGLEQELAFLQDKTKILDGEKKQGHNKQTPLTHIQTHTTKHTAPYKKRDSHMFTRHGRLGFWQNIDNWISQFKYHSLHSNSLSLLLNLASPPFSPCLGLSFSLSISLWLFLSLCSSQI